MHGKHHGGGRVNVSLIAVDTLALALCEAIPGRSASLWRMLITLSSQAGQHAGRRRSIVLSWGTTSYIDYLPEGKWKSTDGL